MTADLGATTLPQRWSAGWEAAPSSPTLRDRHGRWWSAAELDERSRGAAAALLATGAIAGDRILLRAPSSISLVVAHLAVLRAGLVSVPINPAVPVAEALGAVAVAGPSVALVDDDAGHRLATAACPAATVLNIDELGRVGSAEPVSALDDSPPEATALLLFTSGTTGEPKGVPLSHANLLAGAQVLVEAWAWTPADRLVLALPLFHLHGLGVGIHGTLLAGAGADLRPGFDPADVAEAMGQDGASLFFGVPTMYRRLVGAGYGASLAGLRLAVSGSAPLPVELFEAVESASGQRPLERYGLTETVMVAANPLLGDRRPGTVGHALPGVDLRLDPETFEIQVRGPSVFGGYLDRPDASAEAFDRGWFRTGDIGAVDADGYLRIVGRAKELIISGGSNVHPREVEDALRSHPEVTDVAVVGEPDADWGEAVVAFVEAPGAGPGLVSDLEGRARELLAPAKRPKRFELVESLPRNALGKVVKADLGRQP